MHLFLEILSLRVRSLVGLTLFLVCAAFGSTMHLEAHAQTDSSGRSLNRDGAINTLNKYEKPRVWNELDVDLPLLPQKTRFSQFQTTSQSDFQFFVDISSIRLGEDGVVSIVLRAVSPKGSENITYEGFRCETGEYKLYASSFGFDEAWMPVKNPQWRAAQYQTANSYRGDLLKYYICSDGINIPNERQLQAYFRKGKMRLKAGRLRQ
ncbi:MAG: hypothetical protein O3B03_04985 [Proteobacteria bacterium]|nr:hypothetical protein [Pseudomonadota bacterium]